MATILVVDDEPMMLRLCTNILMRGQHDVMQAADGAAALELIRSKPADLALLDVIMPKMKLSKARPAALFDFPNEAVKQDRHGGQRGQRAQCGQIDLWQ